MTGDDWQRVDRHMRLHYGKGLDEMEITDVPGYWQDREGKEYRSTYQYLDGRLPSGRFASPYRTWRVLKAATTAQKGAGGALAE